MEILAQGACELGVVLSARQIDQFQTYYLELAEWNQRVNLTAISGYGEVQVKHFLDSLTVLLALPRPIKPTLRVVDVGSGAGFPGIPLKLAFPDIHLALIESVGKKARFLEHLVDVLGIPGVEVLAERAEALAHRSGLRESFDVATSRGVARTSTLLEYTLPFCCLGGRVVLQKRGIEEELSGISPALEALGGCLGDVYPVQVNGLADGRVLVAVDKTHSTPERYPRRPGMPAKRPL